MALDQEPGARSPHRRTPRRALVQSLRLAQALLIVAALLSLSAPAAAIPAFARKYGTSCVTCHVIFPKLNPFGEAFRRNNYRFPGIDSDFVKQEPIALGQDAYKKQFPNSVWPGNLPANPLSFGFLGSAAMHPDTKSSGGQADNGTAITTQDLIAEAHIWTGGTFDDTTSFWGEVTFGTDGTVDIENAAIFFSDLLFGPHILNIRMGKTFNTLTSFAPHSTYLADTFVPHSGITAFFGSPSGSWDMMGEYTGLEANGVMGGRFNYALGFNAGTNFNVRNSQTVYLHLGVKIGGMRMDGEQGGAASDPAKPWAESALTIDTFGVYTASNFQPVSAPAGSGVMFSDNCGNGGGTSPCLDDSMLAVGGAIRGQISSFEINAGAVMEQHKHATPDNFGATAFTQFDELSYVVFPWLVPAARVELSRVTPNGGVFGTGTYTDLRFIPGVVALVRPNVRLTLSAQFEHASGNLASSVSGVSANWSPFAGVANPTSSNAIVFENESVNLGLWFAF